MKKLIILGLVEVVLLGVGVWVYLNYFSGEHENHAHEVMKEINRDPKIEFPMSFFITSVNPGQGGDLGGLAGADAYCSKLAATTGSKDKTWRAYLSTTGSSSVNARDRIGSGPWYNANGVLVANSVADLHGENFISKTTTLNERGEVVMGRGDTPNQHDILTGSQADGTASTTATTDTTCGNWTSSTTGSALVGHHDRIGINESAPMKSWNSSHGTRGCDIASFNQTGGAGLFYCFAE